LRVTSLDKRKGLIELMPEDVEDLYVLSLVLEPGDLVYSWTLRMLKRGKGLGERGERVKAYIGIKVEKVYFQRFTNRLRIRGVIIEAPELLHAKGSYHTLTVEPGRQIKVIKDCLRNYHLELISRSKEKRLALLVSVGDSEAVIAKLRNQGLEVVATLPVQREEGESLRESFRDSLREVITCIARYYKANEPLVLMAPSLLLSWVSEELKHSLKPLTLVQLKVSEGGLAGIYEAVRSGKLKEVIGELKALEGEELAGEVYSLLLRDRDRVAIGLNEVIRASRLGAVDKLIVLDSFLKEKVNEEELRESIRLVEERGGEVKVIPDSLEAGAKLQGLGGIVAILRYKLPLDNT